MANQTQRLQKPVNRDGLGTSGLTGLVEGHKRIDLKHMTGCVFLEMVDENRMVTRRRNSVSQIPNEIEWKIAYVTSLLLEIHLRSFKFR